MRFLDLGWPSGLMFKEIEERYYTHPKLVLDKVEVEKYMNMCVHY